MRPHDERRMQIERVEDIAGFTDMLNLPRYQTVFDKNYDNQGPCDELLQKGPVQRALVLYNRMPVFGLSIYAGTCDNPPNVRIELQVFGIERVIAMTTDKDNTPSIAEEFDALVFRQCGVPGQEDTPEKPKLRNQLGFARLSDIFEYHCIERLQKE